MSLAPSPIAAQENPATTTDDFDLSRLAPLRIDGRTIFMVPGTPSLPAQQRAEAILDRIQTAATTDPEAPPRVELGTDVFGWTIVANGIDVMAVTELDAAAEGLALHTVAQLRRVQIEAAINSYREERTTTAYRSGALLGVFWTALYVLFLLSLWILRKYIAQRVERHVEALASRLLAQSGQVVDVTSVLAAQRLITRAILLVLLLIATIYYAGRVLDEFAFTRPFAQFILNVVASPISLFAQSLVDELPNLFTLLLIFLLARFVLRLSFLFFRNVESGFVKPQNFDKRWIWPTYRLIRILLILVAVFIAFPYIPGSDTAAFQGASVLLGIMLTFGSSAISSNFLSGLVVVYKRSVNAGDRIKVGDVTGVVEKMSMLDTDIRTFRNELVSVPNTKILASDVINYTQTAQTTGLMISVKVGIGYDEDPKLVEELLLSAAAKVRGIRSVPKPFVMYPSLNSHDVTYELCVHGLMGEVPNKIQSDLNRAVLYAFNTAKVQIMTPFYTADPADKKIPVPPQGKEAARKTGPTANDAINAANDGQSEPS